MNTRTLLALAFFPSLLAAVTNACGGDGGNASSDAGTSATDAAATLDALAVGDAAADGALPGDSGDERALGEAGTGDADAAPPPPPQVRMVNVAHGVPNNGPLPNNLCAQRHGDPPMSAPIFATGVTYGQISPYVALPAGTYDFRILVYGSDCTSDGGIIADGLKDVIVSAPITLTVQNVPQGGLFQYSVTAFVDTGTAVTGMVNVRMHAYPQAQYNTDFFARLGANDTPLGANVAPGQSTAMVALPPNNYWFYATLHSSPTPTSSVTPTPTTSDGVWDGYLYYEATTNKGAFAACPTVAGGPVACTLGIY